MSKFKSNDGLLIDALKKGDAHGYTYLVNTYHHRLCTYAYGLTHDSDLAEDIVQNVFIRTWKKRENLKQNFSLKNFLYKSVYNEFIDQYRRQKSVLSIEKKYIEALTTIVEDEESTAIDRLIKLVKKEIQELPPKCRETFLLSKSDGLTNVEIAEYKNISIKTVEAHMTKAFNILRKKIGDRVDGILFLLFGAPYKIQIKN